MYSLGCILHAIHTHTGPPFQNRHSLKKLRTNLDEGLGLVSSQWRKLPQDVQEVLASLLTRYPNRRLTARQFLESRYFEGLLVGTLRFLERDSFASTSSEAQASFLKGLVSVRPFPSVFLPPRCRRERSADVHLPLAGPPELLGQGRAAQDPPLAPRGDAQGQPHPVPPAQRPLHREPHDARRLSPRGPPRAQALVRHQGPAPGRRRPHREHGDDPRQVLSERLPRGCVALPLSLCCACLEKSEN